jgi:hypothetical protein
VLRVEPSSRCVRRRAVDSQHVLCLLYSVLTLVHVCVTALRNEQVRAYFRALDTNGDGQISKEEFGSPPSPERKPRSPGRGLPRAATEMKMPKIEVRKLDMPILPNLELPKMEIPSWMRASPSAEDENLHSQTLPSWMSARPSMPSMHIHLDMPSMKSPLNLFSGTGRRDEEKPEEEAGESGAGEVREAEVRLIALTLIVLVSKET